MALTGNWIDKRNGIDLNSADDINQVAHAVMELEAGSGTTDYSELANKPTINGVTLDGNKTSADLGIPTESGVEIVEIAEGVDVSAVSSFEYSEDVNGNPLTCNKFRFILSAPNCTKDASWLMVYINGIEVLRTYYYYNKKFTLDFVAHPKYVEATLYNSDIGGSGTYTHNIGGEVFRFITELSADITNAEKTIELSFNYGLNEPAWGEGATLWGYGVK